VPNKRAAS